MLGDSQNPLISGGSSSPPAPVSATKADGIPQNISPNCVALQAPPASPWFPDASVQDEVLLQMLSPTSSNEPEVPTSTPEDGNKVKVNYYDAEGGQTHARREPLWNSMQEQVRGLETPRRAQASIQATGRGDGEPAFTDSPVRACISQWETLTTTNLSRAGSRTGGASAGAVPRGDPTRLTRRRPEDPADKLPHDMASLVGTSKNNNEATSRPHISDHHHESISHDT